MKYWGYNPGIKWEYHGNMVKHNGYIVGIEWECVYIYILVILLGIIEYVYIYGILLEYEWLDNYWNMNGNVYIYIYVYYRGYNP